jgi:hypothetical protein
MESMKTNTSRNPLLTPEILSRPNLVSSIEREYNWAAQMRLTTDVSGDQTAMGWETRTSTVCQTIFSDDTDTD